MSQPYIGQILMFGGNFAPAGWALCNGQSLPISEYDTLFNLIGTTYGGDGETTFNLPDLQGRGPVHMGQGQGISQNYQIGETFGVEQVTLTTQTFPAHNHPVAAVTGSAANASVPSSNMILADEFQNGAQPANVYVAGGQAQVPLAPQAVGPQGGSQPHDNMQPYLTVNFIISLFGVYPSPT